MQRQADLWVEHQPGVQNEFQDSQIYTERIPVSNFPLPKYNKKIKSEGLKYFSIG